MKKIYLMLALAAGLMSSCDMDKEPYNALPDTEGISTPTDFANARVSLYSGLRGCIGGNEFNNAMESRPTASMPSLATATHWATCTVTPSPHRAATSLPSTAATRA